MVNEFLENAYARANKGDKRIAELERELAEARKDSERLDWLENSSLEIYNPVTDSVSCYDLRHAIDNAMKEGE